MILVYIDTFRDQVLCLRDLNYKAHICLALNLPMPRASLRYKVVERKEMKTYVTEVRDIRGRITCESM